MTYVSDTMTLFPIIMLSLVCACVCCPLGSYGRVHSQCRQCPAHTNTTTELAQNIHDCRCNQGFLCMYYKQIHATVTLNTSLAAFENNTGQVRNTFISGMAAAAGVPPSQVHIHFVVIRLNHRRLLSRTSMTGQIIQVSVRVSGSQSLQPVGQYLKGLHLDHSWRLERRLFVLAIPEKPLADLMAVEQTT
jgi:hypothetical protein